MPFDYGNDNLNTGLYEFPATFTFDSGDTTEINTGSGVHLFTDVEIGLNILDRNASP